MKAEDVDQLENEIMDRHASRFFNHGKLGMWTPCGKIGVS